MSHHPRTGALAGLLALGLLAALVPPAMAAQASHPPIRHVFLILLENEDYALTFGESTQDPYLSRTLPAKGALLRQYFGTGHQSLDNYISLLSGQPSTPQSEADCPSFNDFQMSGMTPEGLAIGDGCVYPASVPTLANQLEGAKLSWKGYMEDMGNDPARESATCGHPPLNETDHTHQAEAPSSAVPLGDQYASRHDPFVYFHAILDTPSCAKRVVNLRHLSADLRSVASTPNFAFITPNLCHDGHDGDGTGTAGHGCVNGEPGGLASADKFLRHWVPKILASPAYRHDGLLIITFDESNFATLVRSRDPATGGNILTATYTGEACCEQQTGPNVVRPVTHASVGNNALTFQIVLSGVGGDRTGAVLLSPRIRPGTVSDVPYNHYALLRSLEDLYGLPYLGYAGQSGLVSLGADVFAAH
jgi:phosphatidylinositol-3-phosphatase